MNQHHVGLQIISKAYDFIVWLVAKVNTFPRSQKFVLGDRIERCMFDVLDALIEARYSQQKVGVLQRANITLEKTRFLIRMAKDLRCIDINAYEYAAGSINEIGRMLGGWLKSQKA